MRVPNGAKVIVIDGNKMLLMENRGEAFEPRLEVLDEQRQDNPADREQATDRPGRAFSSVGSGRSAYQETDFHEQAEDNFAAEAAEQINRLSRDGGQGGIVVVASPRTLGRLRQHYAPDVSRCLLAEINKDLTGHPVPEIERCLMQYEK